MHMYRERLFFFTVKKPKVNLRSYAHLNTFGRLRIPDVVQQDSASNVYWLKRRILSAYFFFFFYLFFFFFFYHFRLWRPCQKRVINKKNKQQKKKKKTIKTNKKKKQYPFNTRLHMGVNSWNKVDLMSVLNQRCFSLLFFRKEGIWVLHSNIYLYNSGGMGWYFPRDKCLTTCISKEFCYFEHCKFHV